MIIRCVVFDFDGTLVRSETLKREIYGRVVEEIGGGRKLIERLLNDGVRRDRYSMFDAFVERQQRAKIRCPKATELVDSYSEICDHEIAVCEEVRGATALLTELNATAVPVHLMSATPHDALVRAVDLRGLGSLLRSVTGGPTSKVAILTAIRRSEDLVPEDILVVGDGDDDLEAAERFGAPFVKVTLPGQKVLAYWSVAALTDIPNLAGLEFVAPKN